MAKLNNEKRNFSRIYRPKRVFNPEEVTGLFRSGKDTFEIAGILGCHESDVYNVLDFAIAIKDAADALRNASIPAVSEPDLARRGS